VRWDSNDVRVIALSARPGIGDKIAIRLLEKFGSLKGIMMSKVTQKDLMEVSGVGRVTAKRILMLREKW
jgi:ERCC4-type nuclease